MVRCTIFKTLFKTTGWIEAAKRLVKTHEYIIQEQSNLGIEKITKPIPIGQIIPIVYHYFFKPLYLACKDKTPPVDFKSIAENCIDHEKFIEELVKGSLRNPESQIFNDTPSYIYGLTDKQVNDLCRRAAVAEAKKEENARPELPSISTHR